MKKNKNFTEEKNSESSENDKSTTFDRRGFVKLLATAGVGAMCPVGGILKLVIDKTINTAQAQSILNSRNYVLFSFSGGMPRWLWDNPITPNGAADLYEANNMVKTNFKTGGALGFDTEYSTYFTNGYHMPYLWGLNVPTSSGGNRPMSDLLPNTITIRGVSMESDDHPGGNMKLTAPVPGMHSVSGLAADAGAGLIPSISLKGPLTGASSAYSSEKGTGLYKISGADANFLTSLFAAFQSTGVASSFRDEPLVKAKVDEAIDILQSYAQSNEHATDPVFRDRKKAEELFRGSLVGLGAGTFDTLTAKYDAMLSEIITDAKNGNIPGITSIPIPGISFPLEVPGLSKKLIKFGRDLSNTQINGNIYNFEGHLIGNTDVKSIFDGAHLTSMAKVFALSEFVLLNRLTNSLVCDIDNPLKNLNLMNSPVCVTLSTVVNGVTAVNTAETTIFDIPPANLYSNVKRELQVDSHAVGLVPNLMCFSVQYMGLSACLLELIDQLKATKYSTDPADSRSMFEETVIQVGSDFDRIPDHTGAGSQHGWWGNSFTYISGAIKNFKLLGNIYKGTGYPFGGTWGRSAPVVGVGQGGVADLIRPVHCANSVCAMLRIKSVSTADASLVVVSDTDIEIAPGLEVPVNKAG